MVSEFDPTSTVNTDEHPSMNEVNVEDQEETSSFSRIAQNLDIATPEARRPKRAAATVARQRLLAQYT